uniref:AN1-type zinc finger and ubiquitin domain-containing protein 1 n=1 Tax=Hydra vulgaris TaxID=6087 RepID=T2MA76_HYDVU
MDLYIKTLTGTVFELRVNPFETILSIKAKLQNLEGIPISQQHLVWHAEELEDEFCLFDYNISSGSSLQLVLAMRGGPINMRKLSVEEPFIKEIEEVIESKKDEVWNQIMNDDHQFTLVVFRDGEKLNFFRVYDYSDGSNPSHSESLSTTSLCNVDEDERDNTSTSMAKHVENVITKDKMQTLRKKIELCKNSKISHEPPVNLRVDGFSKHQSFNLQTCHVIPTKQEKSNINSTSRELNFSSDKLCNSITRSSLIKHQPLPPVMKHQPLSSVMKHQPLPSVKTKSKPMLSCDTTFIDKRKIDPSNVDLLKSCCHKTQRNYNHGRTSSENENSLPFHKQYNNLPSLNEKINLHKDISCERFSSSESSKHGSVLKSLSAMNKTETRDFLYRPNKSSHSSITTLNDNFFKEDTIDLVDNESYKALVQWMQPQLKETKKHLPRVPNAVQKHTSKTEVLEKVSCLPSINDNLCTTLSTKKKRLRCMVCSKKLGLATTYECRCSQKFCSVHRYPETHTCSFDYKLDGRKLLEKNNPIVVAPKLPKI